MSDYSPRAGGDPLDAADYVTADQVTILGNGTVRNPLRVGGSLATTFELPGADEGADPNRVGQAVLITTPSDTTGLDTSIATSAGAAPVNGIVVAIENPLAHAPTFVIQFAGIVTLTEAQWNAVVGGSVGLAPGDYYLSDATRGEITTTVPVTSSHYRTFIGSALNSTQLVLEIARPVLIP